MYTTTNTKNKNTKNDYFILFKKPLFNQKSHYLIKKAIKELKKAIIGYKKAIIRSLLTSVTKI